MARELGTMSPRTSSLRTGDESAGNIAPSSGLVFNLSALGWKAFQDLCGTILGSVLGQTTQAFRPTLDEGRDFAFQGTWRAESGEVLGGEFVVQCKFTVSGRLHLSDLTSDFPKVKRLVRAGRCDSYILMTSAAITSGTENDIKSALRKQGVLHPLVMGGDHLDRLIRESSRLRALVPRLYGLGDLTQVLDERRYEQAEALFVSMHDEIRKFVVTAPYDRAIDALLKHGFVLLLGEPAAGKSMIASALAASSIDMWGSQPIKAENAAAFIAAWNPNVSDQLFWIDDAFGVTQYQRQRADEWNQILTQIKAATERGTRVLLTSRDYIWAEAHDDLKLSAFAPLESGHVIVDVRDLTRENKRQILYNHLKYGTQSREFRTAVKRFLEPVTALNVFLPEVARRFGDSRLTARLVPDQASILAFFANPVEHLEEVVGGLGPNEFAALALIFMSDGAKLAPVELTEAEWTAIGRLGTSLSGVIEGLNNLRGSLTLLGPDPFGPARMRWTFKHPTIGDAVRRRIAARYELLEIYLRGAPVSALVTEVTCGDVGINGALVVPPSQFDLVAERLRRAPPDYEQDVKIANFLVTRCEPGFLASHAASVRPLELNPDQPGSVRIAGRLQQLGLLNESVRSSMVQHFRARALDWLDLRLLTDDRIRSLATPAELDSIRSELREQVLDDLNSYVQAVDDNYDSTSDPEDVVAQLSEALETLSTLYPGDGDIARAISDVEPTLGDLQVSLEEKWETPDYDYGDGGNDRGAVIPSGSGVFDDVDA